jgi:transcriptional regulator with XRE-family HTH domain
VSAEQWRIGHSLYILRVVRGFSRAALEEAAGLEAGKIRSFEDGAEEPDAEAVSRIIKAMGYPPASLTDARWFYEMLRQDVPRGAA